MLSMMAVSASSLVVGPALARPAVQQVTASMSATMRDPEELANMYQERWSGDKGVPDTVPLWLKAKAEQVDPRALPDVACVMDGDQEVCGEGAWPTPRPPHLIKRWSIKRGSIKRRR
jgi:hypothetical protein